MSEIAKIAATTRDRAGKGAARATRRAGLIPGVIYGDKKPPVMIAIEPRALAIELNKPGFYTRMFDIESASGVERALCRDLQFHPVTDKVLHADFLRISASSTVHVAVPIHVENELQSPGLKRGGVLNLVEHTIELVGRPDAIPSHISIDLTGKDIGDSVHIADVVLPEGVKLLHADRDFTLITIVAPSGMKSEPGESEPTEGAATT
ncbi:MAG: 50S ribosomal protein L25/general stress protein Ctc [Alphaproteobacteria bacterium]